jgi:mRNA degradation ribonuclease J1/J2
VHKPNGAQRSSCEQFNHRRGVIVEVLIVFLSIPETIAITLLTALQIIVVLKDFRKQSQKDDSSTKSSQPEEDKQ